MITVPQATEKIIRRSRYLTEAMGKDLINASSLARYIHEEVEAMTMKPVTRGSIVMAIKRLSDTLQKSSPITPFFSEAPDMIVRSNLTLYYVKNSPSLLTKLVSIEDSSKSLQKKVLFSYGRIETVILANKVTADSLSDILIDEIISKSFSDVSSITVHLPDEVIEVPGILNLFIKSLSWENIPVLGILITETEFTFVFRKNDVHNAFSIFQSLFD